VSIKDMSEQKRKKREREKEGDSEGRVERISWPLCTRYRYRLHVAMSLFFQTPEATFFFLTLLPSNEIVYA
jgi:hypothetical protein